MAPDEARRFINSAQFGSHLLYPFREGKTIELMDTVAVDGAICHQLQVRLQNGYQIDYYIDIRSYRERKVVSADLRTGSVNTFEYGDYTVVSGMPIARRVESFESGEWVSLLELSEIKINSGVMPWMFSRPAKRPLLTARFDGVC